MIQMQDRPAELKIRQQDESSDDQQSDDLSLSIPLPPTPASVYFFFQYFCFHFVQFFAVSVSVHRIFTHESSYCFQRILAVAILFVCPSVCSSHEWISKNGAS